MFMLNVQLCKGFRAGLINGGLINGGLIDGRLINGGPYKHNVYLTGFKLIRTEKAQTILALIKTCIALIN